MGAFDDGSPLGGLLGFLSGFGGGGGGGGAPGYAPAPQVDQFRSDWNASQQAAGLPYDDKTFTGWLQAQQQPQPSPDTQSVPLPGFLQGLLGGGGNKAAAWQPYDDKTFLSAQQQQAAPEAQTVQLPGFLQHLLGGGNQPASAAPSPSAPQDASSDPMRGALNLPGLLKPPGAAQPEDYGGGSDLPQPQSQAAPVQQAIQASQASSPPLLVGDSIAGHMITFGGGSGTTDRSTVGKYKDGLTAVSGFTPSKILNTVIPGIPDDQIKGRNVVLSTGASNDPNQLDIIPQQIAALKERGATGVTVMGVGTAPQLKGVNDKLSQIASDAGATFAGPLSNVASDGIHSANPKADLAALTQASSGEDYGGGSDLPAVQQAMQGGAPASLNKLGQYAPAAVSALKSKGYSDAAIQGIMANGLAEGGFHNPWVKSSYANENSFGHWQFNKNGELPSYLANEGKDDPQDTANQALYVARRMEEASPGFKDITDPAKATDLVLNKFERPAVRTPRTDQLNTVLASWNGVANGSPDAIATGGRSYSPGGSYVSTSSKGGPFAGNPQASSDPDNSANDLNKIELQRIMSGLGPMPATGDPRAGLPAPAAPVSAAPATLPSAPATLPSAPATLPVAPATMPGVGANGLGAGAASITPLLPQAAAAPAVGGGLFGFLGRNNKQAIARQHEARAAQAQQQALQLNTAKFLNAAGLPLGDALARSGMTIPDDQRLAINQQSAQAAAPVDNSIVPAEYRTLTTQGVPPSIAAEASRKNPTPEALKAADDAINQNKPIPAALQKMADKQIDMLAATRQSRLTLEQLRDHLYDGSLNLNKFNQYLQKGKAATGLSDDETVQYQKYVAAIHTLQSDELRKNSGVQTDKDAEREMDKLTGGGITSTEQAITHFNFLINQGSLAEQNLKQRHEQIYTRSKQKMPDNYWEGVETTLPGSAPTADAKTISSDLYKDHSGKGRPQPMSAPIPGGTSIGLDPARQNQLRSKYGF